MNSIAFKVSLLGTLVFGGLLVLPVVALLFLFVLLFWNVQRILDGDVIAALIAVLSWFGAVLLRFLSEKVEVTDDAIVVSDCFGFRAMPFKQLYRVGLGFWGRGNCCVVIADTRMRTVKGGHFFSRRMIDDVVRQVSVRAKELVW